MSSDERPFFEKVNNTNKISIFFLRETVQTTTTIRRSNTVINNCTLNLRKFQDETVTHGRQGSIASST